MPPRKRNKKKGKGNAAPVEAEAATSASASETPVPASDASAAAQPPAEDNKVVDTSGDAPPAAGSEPAAAAADDATVPPDEPVPLSATPGLFEEGSVEPVDPHTPGAGPAVGSSDDTFGDGSSGYSRIKKDDISDAGSPAVVIDDDSDDVFVSSSPERPDNDPADEQSEPQSGETASETTAVQDDDTPAGAEASPDPLQSLFSESSRSPVNMALSDAEGWAQAFGSGSLSSSGSLSDRSAEVIRVRFDFCTIRKSNKMQKLTPIHSKCTQRMKSSPTSTITESLSKTAKTNLTARIRPSRTSSRSGMNFRLIWTVPTKRSTPSPK